VEVEPFRRFAEQAAALGATHVNVDSLPYNRWRWERDRQDPYPNWSIIRFSLFDAAVRGRWLLGLRRSMPNGAWRSLPARGRSSGSSD
jgi:hypothetical protein